ncbi:MAG: AraC family transcriptional regulator [Burkholderiales bacterium]|nr:AraC family transcriptional regulator [Burkholderiales bacterium]
MSRDPLSDLLRSVRVRGAVFYYVSGGQPWSVQAPPAGEIAEAVMPGCEHVMEYHMIVKGNGWAAIAGQSPVKLTAGDVVMFPQGDSHVISSAPDASPPRWTAEMVHDMRDVPKPMPVTLHKGTLVPGAPLSAENADAVIVCGFIGCDLRPFNPLIAALPRLLHLSAARAGDMVARVIEQAATESSHPRPGGDAVLEQLAEIMFVYTARRFLDDLPEGASGWLAGLRDRYVGKALILMHERPEQAWTVEELAQQVALSRSALYERFVQYLGMPPIQYLANWRIQLGARWLRESNRTVATIAQEVGYDSESAFSRAFRRLVGMPPAAWRREQNRR